MKLFSLLLLLPLLLLPAASPENLINSTCETAASGNPNINYTFCTTSLSAAPGSQCATLKLLGSISIHLIRHNLTDTLRHINRLLKNRTLDSYTRQCLDDCSQLYSDAHTAAKKAARLYNSNKFDDANVQISSIMTDSTTCEDGFQESETDGIVSPLTRRNGHTFQLSAISLAVMKIVGRGSG